jgi:small subunit ribosomal protein S1
MAETSEQTQPEAPQAPVLAAPASSVNGGGLSSSPSTSAAPEGEAGPSEPVPQASGAGSDAAEPSASDATRTETAEATPLAAGRDAEVGEDDGDADGEGSADGEGGADEPANAGGSDDAAGAATGDPTKAKRKRRRRRKRKDGTPSGEVTAAGEGAEAVAPRAPDLGNKKKESHAPFAHFFTGAQGGGKRHAFAVGEVVAGRVQRVDYGVIVVDLFGKAIAIADEYEPRDVPPLPAPPVEHAELASGDPSSEAATVAGDLAAPSELGASDIAAPSELGASDIAAPSELGGTDIAAPSELGATEVATTLTGEHTPSGIETMSQPAVEPPAPAESTASGDIDVAPLTAAAPEASEPHVAHAEPEHAAAPAEHTESTGSTGLTTASGETFAAADDDLDDDHDDETEPGIAEAPLEKPEPPKLGAVFKGRVGAVSESGHVAILNRIIEGRSVRERLERKRHEHKRVHGVVYGFNRGGFDVLVEGLRAFCPASAMALEDIGDPLDFVGHKLEFLLPASRAGSKDLIVSRRSILERLQRRKTKDFLRSLTPGQKFKGRVTAVRDFGLFVDIGGVEGLVHQSELSFAFGVKPSSIAKVGDEIDVQVLRVGGDAKRDSGKKERLTRVSLSVKALLPDPWDAHAAALSEGNVHKGKVVRATEFGAFVEIVPEIEGLLHITELGKDLKHGNQAVREGEEIYVVVDRVDRRARRISLSKLSSAEIADFEAGTMTKDDATARSLRQGANVKVKIEKVEPRVLLARVVGTVGRRGRAFIPNSETGTERGTDLRKKFPVGSEFEVKIIGIDRDGSLKCSVKAMQIDEERQAVKNYRREAAKQGFGTFGDLLRAKLGEAQSK